MIDVMRQLSDNKSFRLLLKRLTIYVYNLKKGTVKIKLIIKTLREKYVGNHEKMYSIFSSNVILSV